MILFLKNKVIFLFDFLATLTSVKDLFTIIQGGKSVFKMKSGLRPVLEKSESEIKINFVYKNSKKTSGRNKGNFEKINAMMLLQIPIMDLENALNQVYDHKYQNFVSSVSSWNVKLGKDVNELFNQADDTSFVQAKTNSNYYKSLSVSSELKNLIPAFNGKPLQTLLEKAVVNLDIVLKDLEKYVTFSQQSKEFQYLTVSFIAKVCVFKPCLEKVNVTLNSILVDVGLEGFCQDPNKGPYDMWQVVGVFTETMHAGKFFKFSKGDKIYLCMSVDGVHKARFNGVLSLFGLQIEDEFILNEKQIVLPKRSLRLYDKYNFFVHNKISFQLKNWNMLNIVSIGETLPFFNSVLEVQHSLDNYTNETYNNLKARIKKSKLTVLEMNSEKTKYENEVKKYQAVIRNSQALVENAKRNYATSQTNFKKAKLQYNRYRRHMISIDKALDAKCQLKTCPYGCVKIPRCQICQEPYKINRTVPSCRVSLEDRSFGKLKTVNGTCSQVVEERSSRYTGNCKGPLPDERNIKKRIAKKIHDKKPLTLDDVHSLETVDWEKGQELRKHVMEAEFNKSLNYKLKNGLLTEQDFLNAEKYRKNNKTYANQLRKIAQDHKNRIILKTVEAKINASEPLTKLDYERLKVCD